MGVVKYVRQCMRVGSKLIQPGCLRWCWKNQSTRAQTGHQKSVLRGVLIIAYPT